MTSSEGSLDAYDRLRIAIIFGHIRDVLAGLGAREADLVRISDGINEFANLRSLLSSSDTASTEDTQ